jgi:preprotein translocase SecE subunit
VQAPQLPDDQVEAEHARPGRVQEVLPLVRDAYAAPGVSLTVASEADVRGGASRPERRPASEAGSGNPISHLIRFIRESVAELKKVEWPGQNQVIQGTVVVLVACIIVGAYLYLNDQIWQEVVKKLLVGR